MRIITQCERSSSRTLNQREKKKWKRRRVLAFPYNPTKPNGLESYGNQKYAVDSTTKTTKIEIYSRRFGVSQIVCVLSQYTWIVFGICFYTDSKMELMTFWHSLCSCCCRTGFWFKRCSTLTTPRMRSICASVWENGCVVFKRALNWIRLRLTRATISLSNGNPQHVLCTYCINQTNLQPHQHRLFGLLAIAFNLYFDRIFILFNCKHFK